MSWTDVKAVRVCTTGSIGVPPLRIRAIYTMTSATKGAVSIHNENTGLIVYDTLTSTLTYQRMSGAGVRFADSCSITAPAGTVLTIYYD